jgi:sodium/potassium-transporting ATPase subunit alpha
MVPFVVYIAFQIPAPLSSILVMYISIGTDLIPAIALAYEPA